MLMCAALYAENNAYIILKIPWLSYHQSELCYCVLYAKIMVIQL